MVDPDDRILLVRWELPDDGHIVNVWGTPGGGIEGGEEAEEALRRELDEELGLHDFTMGPMVWERTHIVAFVNGLWDGQHDHFFLVENESFEPAPRLTRDQLAAEHLMEIRWWTPAEMLAFEPDGNVFFAPRRLPELFSRLRRDGPPPHPVDTGP